MNSIVKFGNTNTIEIIENDLKKEALILEDLIQSVLTSNQKIKQSYMSYLDVNSEKLQSISDQSHQIHQDISNSEIKKEKLRLNAFIISQKKIFDLNGDYRIKFIEDSMKSFSKHNVFAHIEHILPSAEQLMRLIYNIQENVTEYTFKHIRNIQNEKLKHTDNQTSSIVSKLDALFSDKKHDIESKYNTLLEKLSIILPIEEIDQIAETYTQKIGAFIETMRLIDENHVIEMSKIAELKTELIKSIYTQVKTKTESFRKQLQYKLAQSIQDEKKDLIDLSSQSESIELAIEHQDQLGQSSNNQRTRLKSVQKKLRHTHAGKMDSKTNRAYSKYYKKAIKANVRSYKILLQQTVDSYAKKMYQTKDVFIEILNLTRQFSVNLFKNLTTATDQIHNHAIIWLQDHVKDWINIEELTQQIQLFESSQMMSFKQNQESVNLQQKTVETKLRRIRDYIESEIEILDNHLKSFSDLYTKEIDLYNQTMLHTYHSLNEVYKHVSLEKKAEIESLRLREQLQETIIENQLLIENANREYQIQMDKAHLTFEHEKDMDNVRNDRIDSSLLVTKSMIKAMIQRQTNFADQQIQFTEEEYKARLEHSETLYHQELSYIEQRIRDISLNYQKQLDYARNEYEHALSTLKSRKSLFDEPRYISKIESEIEQLSSTYQKKIEIINQAQKDDDQLCKYDVQLHEIKKQIRAIQDDASAVRNQNLAHFNALKKESDARLKSLEETVGSTKLIEHVENIVNNQNNIRLKDALEAAERIHLNKVKIPTANLNELNRKLDSIKSDFSIQFEFSQEHHFKLSTLQSMRDQQDKRQIAISEHIKAMLQRHLDRFDQLMKDGEPSHKHKKSKAIKSSVMSRTYISVINQIKKKQTAKMNAHYLSNKGKLMEIERALTNTNDEPLIRRSIRNMVKTYGKHHVFRLSEFKMMCDSKIKEFELNP